MRGNESGAKGEFYRYKCLHQKKEQETNYLILQLKESDKEEQTKPKASRKKEMIRAEIKINF